MTDVAFEGSIAGLFNSKRFSDVIIRCVDRDWHAHKAVICTRSNFFDKACEGEFKESQSGVIELHDDPAVVHAVLNYIYTGDYDDACRSFDGQNALTFNVQVFALAEKYFVKPLLHVASEKFTAALSTGTTEDDLTEAVEEWSEITSDGDWILGNVIVETTIQRKGDLLNPERADSAFRATISKIPYIIAEITTRLSSQVIALEGPAARAYRCPGTYAGSKRCFQSFMAALVPHTKYQYTCDRCNSSHTYTTEQWQTHCIASVVSTLKKV